VIHGLLVYMILLTRCVILEVDETGFDVYTSSLLRNLQKVSFLLFVWIVSVQVVINVFQLTFLKHFMNISFTFDVPLMILFLSAMVYLLSDYFAKVIEIKQENELFI